MKRVKQAIINFIESLIMLAISVESLMHLVLLAGLVNPQILENSQGSCIKAGCTNCLNCPDNDIYANLDCFCDDLCLESSDCCADIYQYEYCTEPVEEPECASGSVRLINGSGAFEGLVEICIFQSWHPMCANQFSETEAGVVCGWLGFSTVISNNAATVSGLTQAYGAMCKGNESRITECLVNRDFCQLNILQPFITCGETNGSGAVPSGERPTLSCTAECNPQYSELQYKVCCDPDNFGKFVKAIKSDANHNHPAYIACPKIEPDWCINN